MLEPIQSSKRYKNFQEYLEEGREMQRRNPIKLRPIIDKWIKKLVSRTDWNNHYKYQSSYCFLGKEEKGVWLGFVVANQIPLNCEECTDDELIQIDNYRRSKNINPFPLTLSAAKNG